MARLVSWTAVKRPPPSRDTKVHVMRSSASAASAIGILLVGTARELVGPRLGWVDLGRVEALYIGRERSRGRGGAVFGEVPVGRQALHALFGRGLVYSGLAQQVLGGHSLGDFFGAGLLDPLVGAHDGIGKRLHCVGIGVDK